MIWSKVRVHVDDSNSFVRIYSELILPYRVYACMCEDFNIMLGGKPGLEILEISCVKIQNSDAFQELHDGK